MTLVLRSTKGSRLTHNEMDGNWQHAVDSANQSFVQSGTPASGTVAAAINDLAINVKNAPFNAKGDDATDDSAAIQAAIDAAEAVGGAEVFFPLGVYLCAGLTTEDSKYVLLKGVGKNSILKKNANGQMLSLGRECQMETLAVDGNGANFTGIGVMVDTGALDNISWRRFINCDMYEMDSYCIEWSGDRAGYLSDVVSGTYRTRNNAVHAFKVPDSDTNGNRKFVGVNTSATPFIDLAGGRNTEIIGGQGADIDFSGGHIGTRIIGFRHAGGTAVVFDGTFLQIQGCLIGQTDVTFAATLANSFISGNIYPSGTTFTDSAPGISSGNSIEYGMVTYTPTWTASGAAPAIENGSLNGAYWREGQHIRVNITFVAGSATTFGTGEWSFSLPKTAGRTNTGSAKILDSGTGHYAAISHVATAASTVKVYGYNVGTAVASTVPITWASGDQITLDIVYPISG